MSIACKFPTNCDMLFTLKITYALLEKTLVNATTFPFFSATNMFTQHGLSVTYKVIDDFYSLLCTCLSHT